MPAHAPHALVCDHLVVQVPGCAPLATVHARLLPGRVTAILGPNGAGKSTLLSLLSGQRHPRQGGVYLGDLAVAQVPPATLARQRAVVPQDTTVAFDFTVQEVVELGRFPHRRAPSRDEAGIVRQAMAATGVAHLAGRGVNTLSGGERARAHLARALAQVWEPPPGGAPRWLLLDEPTAALDLAHQHQAMRLVRRWALEQGVGVVAVLHDLNLALRYAHDAIVLGGTAGVTVGAAAQVLRPELVQAVWATPCRAVEHGGGLQYVFGGEFE